MTRCVSNWNFALRRVFSKKLEKKRLTICTVISVERRWLRVARIISHVRNMHAEQIDVRFNLHIRVRTHEWGQRFD